MDELPKELFARKPTPFPGPPRSIGGYSDGCLAGAAQLPGNGPSWQVMRLSRNRNWGNPHLVRFIERFAKNAKKVGWNGLLVGDMSQPRGGPMLSGHTSHQVGLDVDIWFTPMPDHVQSREEREFSSATDVVAPDLLDVDPEVWTHTHTELIRTAALTKALKPRSPSIWARLWVYSPTPTHSGNTKMPGRLLPASSQTANPSHS